MMRFVVSKCETFRLFERSRCFIWSTHWSIILLRAGRSFDETQALDPQSVFWYSRNGSIDFLIRI